MQHSAAETSYGIALLKLTLKMLGESITASKREFTGKLGTFNHKIEYYALFCLLIT